LKGKRLTAINKDLFDFARKALSNFAVWSSDGKILVKLTNDQIYRIKSMEDVLQLQKTR
jgi:hypothetical protein